MAKNGFIKSICLVLSLSSFGSQTSAYTLQEAVNYALSTSPDMLIETTTREVADKQLRGAYAGFLPTLDLTAGWGEQFTNNATTRDPPPFGDFGTTTLNRTEFNMLANQMLFDGFAVYHDVQGRKARVMAEAWRVNGTAQDVSRDVMEAFLDVLRRKELVKLAKQNLATHERIYGQIEKRSEGGVGSRADLDQVESRLAFAQTNLISEEANLADAETEFLRRVGFPVPSYLEQPDYPSPFPASEQEAVDLALQNHPVLHAVTEDVAVSREAHKAAKAPFSPRMDLQLELSHNHNIDGSPGPSDDAQAMLRVRWNVFSGGKDLAKLCETAYQMQEAQEVFYRANRQVVQSIRVAWVTFSSAKRQLRYFKDHVDASVRTSQAYQKQFNIGQRTLLDLLDSENELFNARMAYVNGQFTELTGMFRVLHAMGCLTESLGAPLPKEAELKPLGLLDGTSRFFNKTTTLFDK